MRMSAADLADVTGATYTYLMNGLPPAANWTGLFAPGERVRLRVINGSAMSYFDVRIPGLTMTVVAADGLPVHPVTVDEFRIAVAETYDVIVEPTTAEAYTILAQAMDRTGYAAGTLAVRAGLRAAVPALDPRPVLSMADMGHGGMDHGSMDHGAMDHAAMPITARRPHQRPRPSTTRMRATPCRPPRPRRPGCSASRFGARQSAGGHADDDALRQARRSWHWPARQRAARAHLRRPAKPGRRPRRPRAQPHDRAAPHRPHGTLRVVVRRHQVLDAAPLQLTYGERVRIVLVNDTMMTHPIHLHGMWSDLEDESGQFLVRKHTIDMPPGSRRSYRVTADALGRWAYHCHLLYHMEAGMFREVRVEEEFAPYLGMTWQRTTAGGAVHATGATGGVAFVTGLRFWF
jgi:FtsP/CotA-like multicopper oxidase with cupredoxin domain